jgi:hypothetical protein
MLVYVKRHLNYRASDEPPILEDGELSLDADALDPVLQDESELLQLFGGA